MKWISGIHLYPKTWSNFLILWIYMGYIYKHVFLVNIYNIYVHIYTYIGLSKRDRLEYAWINMHINKPIQVYKRKFFNVMICFVCSKWNKDLIRQFIFRKSPWLQITTYIFMNISIGEPVFEIHHHYQENLSLTKFICIWWKISFHDRSAYNCILFVKYFCESQNLHNIVSCKFIRLWNGISMCKWFTL